DALRIVRVAVGREAAGLHGVEGIADVDHVEAARARGGTHAVGKAAVLVDDEVVRVAEPAVDRVGRKVPVGVGGEAAEAGEVEDLHAMPARLADDEGVVAVRLDVPPGGVVGLGGQFAEHLRVVRVGDVYEDGAAPRTGEGVFAVRLGVGPAPHVVGRARTERAARAGR